MADSRLRRLLAFDRQFRRDQAQSPVFLHRRDRRFALDCQDGHESPTVDRWLSHLQRIGQPGRDAGTVQTEDELLGRWRGLLSGFALAGVIIGVIAMAGLLFFEGGQRINLTLLLAFAALQSLLAIVTMVQSAANWQPWHPVLKRFGLSRRESPLKPLMPAMMARIAHTAGVCFGLAGIATLLVLVAIQDLAFGWSTTLSASAESYHRLLGAIAWPWQTLWPAAVPELALVESTRFFRASVDSGTTNPQLWGQWWPFVVMVWLFYVVMPRLAGLILAQIQIQIRARKALARHPGMVALDYRLETPTVDTGNQHNEAEDSPDEQTAAQLRALPDSQILIYWAGAGNPELPDSLTTGHLLTETAGGQNSLTEDEQAIQRCADLLGKQNRPAVILVTRAWEPPIAELEDFIELARHHWPRKTQIALLPYVSDITEVKIPRHLGQWLRFVERLDDKRIWVSQPNLRSPESAAHKEQPEGFS